jgi:hypothetical protein
MGQTDSNYQIYMAIERRIKQRYDRRVELASHAIAYFLGLTILWLFIVPEFSDGWTKIAAVGSLGWTIGFLIHALQIAAKELEERAVIREMERLGLYSEQKAKRWHDDATHLQLTDDGELYDPYFDEPLERTSYE